MRPIILVLGGCLLAALAILISEERLISVGVMDASLQSDNPLTVATARFEIKWGRALLAVFAALTIAIGLFWQPIGRSRLVAWIHTRDLDFPGTYEQAINGLFDRSLLVLGAGFILALFYLRFGNDIFSVETLLFINLEDGVLEYASAILLLIASVIAFVTGQRLRGFARHRAFHFFLALLFFLMCGEEISWGQRIIGFETSDALKELNVQEEVNLHNMFGYLFDHLFIALFFAWGCILPVLFAMFKTMRQLVRAVGLPVPSWGLALLMLLITLMQDQTVIPLFGNVIGLRTAELREVLSTGAFVMLMLQSLRHMVVR